MSSREHESECVRVETALISRVIQSRPKAQLKLRRTLAFPALARGVATVVHGPRARHAHRVQRAIAVAQKT